MSSANPIGSPFIELTEVESTNNYAIGLLREGMAQHGTLVFAHHQTRGRGQREKSWASNRNESLTMSVIVCLSGLSISVPFELSMLVSVSVCKAIEKMSSREFQIKWPNDIYYNDRKAGGILIENQWKGSQWVSSVIGIGINLNQESFEDLNKAISLRSITGNIYEPVAVAKHIAEALEERIRDFEKEKLNTEYLSRLYRLDKLTGFSRDSNHFSAVVKGVTEEGQLILQRDNSISFESSGLVWEQA